MLNSFFDQPRNNLFGPKFKADPYSTYARMREHVPVFATRKKVGDLGQAEVELE